MFQRIVAIIAVFFLLQTGSSIAGSEGSEALSKKKDSNTADECFEGVSRSIFKFNHALDRAVFEPVAKGYRKLPVPIRKGTSNVVSNLRSLLTLSNNLLQGQFKEAGYTAGRFVINSTVGILGIWDPAAAAFGFESSEKEDFGQTLGTWGSGTGCYFVLPIIGPTTVRDTVGMVGNAFLDPVWQITHDTEVNAFIGNENYSEHNYYYYRGIGGVDFRAKNIDSLDNLEKNSMDFYASIKSLYVQDRQQKILNSEKIIHGQDDSDWEEIETN